MNTEELLVGLYQTLMAQNIRLPDGMGWLPIASATAVAAAGVLFLVRGAKWAPGIVALGFLALGGFGGYQLGLQIGVPTWLSGAIGGGVAAVIGVAFFRFWQASALAVSVMLISFGVYFAHSLSPAVSTWISPQADDALVTLQPAGAVVGENAPSVADKLSSLWTHLSASVPNFQLTLGAVLAASGLAGLVFGLLLPRASRALWAATIGTLLLGAGSVAVLQQASPAALDWLSNLGTWSWGVIVLVWALAFVYNLKVMKGRLKAAADPVENRPAKNKPVVA